MDETICAMIDAMLTREAMRTDGVAGLRAAFHAIDYNDYEHERRLRQGLHLAGVCQGGVRLQGQEAAHAAG